MNSNCKMIVSICKYVQGSIKLIHTETEQCHKIRKKTYHKQSMKYWAHLYMDYAAEMICLSVSVGKVS